MEQARTEEYWLVWELVEEIADAAVEEAEIRSKD